MKIPIRCQIIVNLAVALCLTTQSWADRSGPYWSGSFVYFVDGDSIEITGYYTAEDVATVEIPAEIAGLPVTSIGDRAFSHEEIISITIPEGVTFIGAQAFFDCSSLTSVTIPEGVTSIGSETFSSCNSLTNVIIPDGVTTIGCAAFSFCTSLTSVSIPATTTSIQGYSGGTDYRCESFFGCSALNEVVVAPGNPVYSSRDGVLFSADGSILLRCPRGKSGGYSIPSGVTTIAGDYYKEYLDFGFGTVCFPWGRGAFSGCVGLTDVTIPASVSHIGISAFSGCSALSRISLADGIARIDEQAFSQCTGLTSFTIPPSVTSIGSRAFSECTGLTSIVISEGVTRIAEFAFFGCSGLTSVTIPASVTSIEGVLFRECSSLGTIDVEPDNPVYVSGDGVLIDAMNGILLECPDAKMDSYDVPKNITSIGESAFFACTKLSSITLPEGVTAVGSRAFWGCTGLLGLAVPASVSTIGESAFEKCTGLADIAILEGVTSIGSRAFSRCGSLTSVTIPASVTSIADSTFSACIKLTAVTIPEGVTRIERSAFSSCRSLTSVTIPRGVTGINQNAFEGCSSLRAAVFLDDAPPDIGNHAFYRTAPDFTVYYLSTGSGFTSPTWEGYPAVEINPEVAGANGFFLYPIRAPLWLIEHGLPHDADADLAQDLNGDGVSLLMAYALNLDPNQNLQGHMPVAHVDGGSLSLTFYAGNTDVMYQVESSRDLQNWEDVPLSDITSEGLRTASVPIDSPSRYLRLRVQRAWWTGFF